MMSWKYFYFVEKGCIGEGSADYSLVGAYGEKVEAADAAYRLWAQLSAQEKKNSAVLVFHCAVPDSAEALNAQEFIPPDYKGCWLDLYINEAEGFFVDVFPAQSLELPACLFSAVALPDDPSRLICFYSAVNLAREGDHFCGHCGHYFNLPEPKHHSPLLYDPSCPYCGSWGVHENTAVGHEEELNSFLSYDDVIVSLEHE